MAEYTIDKIEYGDNVYKLQDNVSGYVSGGNVIPYLTCGTAAGTAAKTTTLVTGTLPTTLTTGTRVAVKFTNSNSIANPTITIGSYGAIAIKRYGTTAPSTSAVTSWNAGNVITLVYDGTYWMMADWTTTNSTYSEISETNITSGSGTSTGLVSGRRAKAAVNAFAPVKDVIVNGDSVVSGTGAAALITVPTKTSQLTNDSGFITSYKDEKVKHTHYTGNTGGGRFYLTTVNSTAEATSTINTEDGLSFYFNKTLGTRILELGGGTTSPLGYGVIKLYTKGGTYSGELAAGSTVETALTSDRGWELPDKTGTIALTSDIPTVPTITLNGSSTTSPSFYAPTGAGTLGYVLKSNGSGAPSWISAELTDEKLGLEAITSGSTYYPVLTTNSTTAAKKQFDTTGISYTGTSGNTINGTAILTLGNNATDGSGKYGKLTIYSTSQYGTTLQVGSALTADRNIYLPNKSGTIALEGALTDYLKKPAGDYNPFGWKLTNAGTDIPVWNPPETFVIIIYEDEENPGTFYLTSTPDEVRDAWSNGETLVLSLWLYNQNTMTLGEEQRLVNYYVEDDNNDYQIIWFSGVKNIWDATTQRTTTKTITCGIYLDEDSQTYVDGQVVVQIADDSGGMYDFETTLTPSIDARGTYALSFLIYPVDVTDLTISNIVKIKAYLVNSADAVYPLICTYGYAGSSPTYVNIYLKSIQANVQSTSTATVTGTLHIIAPFEINSVAYGK